MNKEKEDKPIIRGEELLNKKIEVKENMYGKMDADITIPRIKRLYTGLIGNGDMVNVQPMISKDDDLFQKDSGSSSINSGSSK